MIRTRLLVRGLVLAAVVAAVAATTAAGTPDITKTRVEQALAPTFANLYVQQAAILGIPGITVSGIDASAACDRGGPNVADVGPGTDWICMVSFNDDDHQLQIGKFEVQIRADSTYVAGGPSKIIGLATITDKKTQQDVPNPVFEFDGTLDPDQP
ncbi:hypothetical protein ACFV5G_00740 [Streptomyces sp. NPDC059766]|uniref:hypothetical protein n=1 Tax=Streptomyces sp. NPDC059766 TaxID=3346940 RepID=UPI00364ED8D4